MKLTIAIPTMRRWNFLKDSLPIYLSRPEVEQVILCDETGDDCDSAAFLASQHPKLRLYKNERCLGIYENKLKVLRLAKESGASWIALLDSDNFFTDDWFECLSSAEFNKKFIYASADFKNVNIDSSDVTRPCTEFSGKTISASNWNTVLESPLWNILLNDGNWVLPAEALNILPREMRSSDLQAADAIFMLRCFVKGGFSIHYLPELEYIHTVHSGSTWLQTEVESTKILNRIDWSM
jgi:hypothetical protein